MVGKATSWITSSRSNAAGRTLHRICNGRRSLKRRSRIAPSAIAAESSRSSDYMGFYFRKSVGFGPFRLNLSKSGVGVSFGVRGARISAGPRGTYISVGRNGFYYRQKIDSPSSRRSSPSGGAEPFDVPAQGQRIDSADV